MTEMFIEANQGGMQTGNVDNAISWRYGRRQGQYTGTDIHDRRLTMNEGYENRLIPGGGKGGRFVGGDSPFWLVC
jgi:hypothetical protein